MKKHIVLATFSLFAISTMLTSCSKDEESPIITLTGGAEQSFDLGAAADPGSTVADNKDDGLTATSDFATVVRKDEVNSYTVTYTSTDKAGNIGKEEKTVKVKSDLLAGSYSCVEIITGATDPNDNGTYNYILTVTQSSTDYNKIIIGGFGGSTSNATATVSGTTFTIPAQSVSGVSVSGTGTYDGAAKKITSITYVASGFGNGSVTCTKQ